MAFGELGATGALIGGPTGAAVGLGLDLLLAGEANKAAAETFEQNRNFELQAFGIRSEAAQAQLFEQQLNLSLEADRIARAAELGLNLQRASAFAAGISGKTVDAISRTRLVQEGNVRAQIARQFQLLDANYARSGRALVLQTKMNIANAAMAAKNAMTSPLELISGLAMTGGALYKVGAFDAKTGPETAATVT